MNIGVIIQARMGSTRLPGKVMLDLCGKPVIEHLIDRVSRSKHKPAVIIATTINNQDDVLVEMSQRKGIEFFRGSEDNVLERYYLAAEKFYCDVIVRITSDCPLYEVSILDSMLDLFIVSPKVDYLSNTIVRTFPRGFDTEIFTFKALEKAYHETSTQSCREHVTPYIYQNPELFTITCYKNDTDLSEYRWTLDTIEDFELISSIYNYIYPSKRIFNINDILDAYGDNPQWNMLNKHIEQKKVDYNVFEKGDS